MDKATLGAHQTAISVSVIAQQVCGTASVAVVTKKRYAKSEARDALIEYGSAELSASGVTIVPKGLSLDEACKATGVPRSSGYAIFSGGGGRPADAYSAAVISHITNEIREMNAVVLELATQLIDSGVPIKEVVRQIMNALYVSIPTSWIVDVAIRCSARLDNGEELRDTVEQLDTLFSEGIVDSVYRVGFRRYGMETRPCYGERGIEIFAICAASLIEGWNLRTIGTRFSGVTEMIKLGDGGPDDLEWSPLSLAAWALVREFFGIDDD